MKEDPRSAKDQEKPPVSVFFLLWNVGVLLFLYLTSDSGPQSGSTDEWFQLATLIFMGIAAIDLTLWQRKRKNGMCRTSTEPHLCLLGPAEKAWRDRRSSEAPDRKPLSREALAVIWSSADGQEELPGIVLYGLAEAGGWHPQPFPYSAWPPEAEHEESYLYGDQWLVVMWEVRLPQWPEPQGWHTALRHTLQRLLDGGCVVSWLGDGFLFNDPPELLLPEHMSGGVLATLTSTGEYTCHFGPDTPVVEITDEEMLAFRQHTHGLADTE